MSKALKPVSATKTAETQLEDLMQALPENRLEDLSLQTQAIDCLAPYTRPLSFGFSNKVSGTGGRMFNA
jgi:hypothetical protein